MFMTLVHTVQQNREIKKKAKHIRMGKSPFFTLFRQYVFVHAERKTINENQGCRTKTVLMNG